MLSKFRLIKYKRRRVMSISNSVAYAMANNPQSLEPCWMDRISALRTVGTVLMLGEYKTVICFMRSSEGNKFKLSNSLTLPPTDVLVTK